MSIISKNILNATFPDLKEKFWGVKLTEEDKKNLILVQKAIKFKNEGLSTSEISKKLSVSKHTISNWLWSNNIPYCARLASYDLKALPASWSWLSINSTRGGLFTGPWIMVPSKVMDFRDISKVLHQLSPLPEVEILAKKFEIRDLKKFKHLFFAYLLGIMLGDASKDKIIRLQRVTRRLTLRLTKLHPTNEDLGEFVSLCMRSLGLRMNRGKDMSPGEHNKYPFYTWHSQSSQFLAWMFNVCLGLNDIEVTTYTRVKMGWLLKVPNDFKIWFLQGVADSDGYVDFNSFQVGIISQPNTNLIRKILYSLKIKNSVKTLRKDNLEAVIVSVGDAYKIPLFNPFVKSYRYGYMEKLATAQKLDWHMSQDLNKKIRRYIDSGLRGSTLVKKVIETENIRVRPKAIRRILLKLEKDR